MKLIYFYLLLILLLSMGAASGQTIRVTNGQNLSAIIANATPGSILLIEAGVYGDVTINKKLHLVGPGYFLANGSQATLFSAILGTVKFVAGSDQSTMTGMVTTSSVYVGANSVIISKCYLYSVHIGYNGQSEMVNSGNILKQSFININVAVYNLSSGFTIKNNILPNNHITVEGQANGDVANNTLNSGSIFGPGTAPAFVNIRNNICQSISYISQYSGINNNIIYSNQTGLHTSNRVNISSSSVYVGIPGAVNPDAQFQLSANSPAKGAGEGGIDCGAFGGEEPYVLSGLPAGPIVYELTVPSQVPSTSTLNVRVKVRVQN